jgi:uncharacterized protein
MYTWGMRFVGRSGQLASLRRRFEDVSRERTGQMIAVRGRRQVGKSRLYTEFIAREQTPHVYYTALKDAGADAQLEAFQRDVLEASTPLPDAETLFASRPTSWSDAFGRIRLAAERGPIVVVLDEFPWAAQSDPSLEGALQVAWDRHLQHLGVLLVLIGSDIHMMERLTDHDRALYGRAIEDVVRPFNPAEIAEAIAPTSAMAVFDALLVTGGYPKLLADLRAGGSPLEYVRRGFHDENSNMVVVAQRSLAAEFPPEAQARRVLSAIGGEPVGHATFSSVVGRLPDEGSTAATALARALKVLGNDKGVVAIDTPSGMDPSSKLRRYRVDDPYLRFWFRFVEPQLAAIARGRADLAVAAFDRGWEAWRGVAIEPIVHQAVDRLSPELDLISESEEVASWWTRDNTVEVDLVASGRRGAVLAIGSVKWRERRQFTPDELLTLAQARSRIPGASGAPLIAVCPAGGRPNLAADLILDADDLLAAWTT